ncbi:MAG TPA: protein kinase [Thermomicrobiales bacterium]|nr:protein kinase [Thermomicrobiales bacterium]
MNDWLGGTLGNYSIEESLGTGGMGRVYRAVHIHINRVAAVKVLHEQFQVDPAFQARFLREAQAIAALQHPNIVDVYDFNDDQGVFYLVMEYVPDGSLRSMLKEHAERGTALPLAQGLELIRQAAEALDYAHRSGMVHRDIKPDNLLLRHDPITDTFIVKVADFGLARLGDSVTLTAEGQAMGTPAYMSPEQCQGTDLDGRSDIYSLGVVLYEVITGATPFVMRSLTDAIYKHVYVEPPSPLDVRPDLPDELAAIALRCMAKNPVDRFQTAGELAAALARLTRTDLRDVEQAVTLAEPLPPVDQLRVALDSGEAPLTPGEATALTVTLVNAGRTAVHASISIDGIPEDWISTPPRDVLLAPGAEISGPIRVAVPATATGPGEYPVVVRAAALENPALRAEATTRLLLRPVQPVGAGAGAGAGSGGGGTLPPGGEAIEDRGRPGWLAGAAVVLLLLVVGAIAYALLRPDGGDDEDTGVVADGTPTAGVATTTATIASTASATDTAAGATATAVVIVGPGETPTVKPAATATLAAATETPAPAVLPETIVFTAGRNLADSTGTLDIYQMNPDGSDQRPLISQPNDDWLAAISPDGRRVVWVSRQHGNHQLYIAMVDGTGVRRLTTSTGDDLYPAWAPDSVHILFSRNEDGDDELYVLNVDNGTLVRLTDNDAYDGFAAWSPDGTRIAGTSSLAGNNDIYVSEGVLRDVSADRLTDDPANDFNPVWSPDGTQLAFVSNRGGDNDIYRMQADGSGLIPLTSSPADEFAPAWSPDGSRIAFCRQTGNACDVVVINTDGSGELVLASNASQHDPDITWSPDSMKLAYLSEESGNYDVFTVALFGSPPARLTDAPGNDANLTWFAPK